MNYITILRIVLSAYTLFFGVILIKDCIAHKEEFNGEKVVPLAIIGFITNFLDTWGIGSFATTQAGFKFTNSCEDELMPGTLNVGDTFPVVTEALLFFGFVELDALTLVLMLASAAIGAVVGAGVVCKWPLRLIRYGLGAALIVLAIVLGCKNAGVGPFGLVGEATALTGMKLVIGVFVNFFLGAFMTLGVGLYAPCMALVNALGMNPASAFPIMMGSCAFLMPSAGIKFVKEGKYDRKASLCLAIFGSIGAVVAYLLAKYAFDLKTLTWIIIVVMIYTAITFFRDAAKTQAQ